MTDKRLSLEHIIRNIAQGKFIPSDQQKVTLEHAIKNVVINKKMKHLPDQEEKDTKLPRDYGESVSEAVGILGTDKYQGTQFKNVKSVTPHIAPDKHTQKGETVSAARNIAKIKTSPTMQHTYTEDNLEEGKHTFSVKDATKTMEKASDFLKDMLQPVAKQELSTVVKEKAPAKTAEPEAAPQPLPPKPLPKAPETPPDVKISMPDIKTQPNVTMLSGQKTATAPATETKTKAATQTPVSPKDVPKAVDITKNAAMPSLAQKIGNKAGSLASIAAGGVSSRLPARTSYEKYQMPPLRVAPTKHKVPKMHRVHEESGTTERKKIEDMPRKDAGDRHNIELVGRKDSDPKTSNEKTSRQAQYKFKIIDEAKAAVIKKVVKERKAAEDFKSTPKQYGEVVINPELNTNNIGIKEGKLPSPMSALGLAADAPEILDLIKKGEYKKALSSAGTSAVQGAATYTPGVGTFLSAMEPSAAGEGENEFARQKELGITPKTPTPPSLSNEPKKQPATKDKLQKLGVGRIGTQINTSK